MADANNNPPAAAAATHFALTPAKATDDVIDYNTKQGAAIWLSGSKKLSEELFDCVPEGLRDFLELTKKRSKLMGWDTSVMSILDDPDDVAGPAKDLDHYGSISLEYLQANARIYADTPTRVAQDSMMLFTALHDSLSKIGRDKVTLYSDEYTIDGIEVGILFLKIIVRESHIDTNATTSTIRPTSTRLSVDLGGPESLALKSAPLLSESKMTLAQFTNSASRTRTTSQDQRSRLRTITHVHVWITTQGFFLRLLETVYDPRRNYKKSTDFYRNTCQHIQENRNEPKFISSVELSAH